MPENHACAGAPATAGEVLPQADEFRAAVANLTAAVSVVATGGPGGAAGVTCSAVFSISDDPPTIGLCVHRKGAANAAIRRNGVLCVNCLRREQKELSQIFAGVGAVPMPERFAEGEWEPMQTGAPSNRRALVSLDCELVETHDVGTHSLFVARVVSILQRDRAEPLIYFRRAYATALPI